MTNQALSSTDIESCQKIILDFAPVPVTDRQRQILEDYQEGNQKGVRDAVEVCGNYGQCLLALIEAKENESDAIAHLSKAAELAIQYAGVSNSSELYTKISEVLPNHFDDEGAINV